jgi:hypothetical protein
MNNAPKFTPAVVVSKPVPAANLAAILGQHAAQVARSGKAPRLPNKIKGLEAVKL